MTNTNKFIKTGLIFSLFLASIFYSAKAYAGASSDLHIYPDGSFVATNVVVFQKSGNTILFSRVTWDETFLRITLLVNDKTSVTKAHGERAVISDINEGDVLNVSGALTSGGGGFNINVTKITDNSLQVESKTVSGTIKSINSANSSFVLPNQVFGNNTTVIVNSNTPIKKGVRNISFSDLVVGDKILSVFGAYDYPTDKLTASTIEVYQDKGIFTQRNFQGTLKSISGTTLPITITVNTEGKDYTVYIPLGSTILNNAKSPASLSRFVVGDTVRFYGGIRQTNLNEIDASILRDINF